MLMSFDIPFPSDILLLCRYSRFPFEKQLTTLGQIHNQEDKISVLKLHIVLSCS
uniref:Uncharacterized protein n=1 Tax=Rhizophora mucronata TaxID=61149 RepID=A0A2P2PIC8_RHIMU